MGSRSDLHCWEIMQCSESKTCRAKKNPEKFCWEVARENHYDYRNYFNICRDCIVHLLKTGSPILSDQEIKNVVEAKTNCVLSHKSESLPSQTTNLIIQNPG
jgi:hypothetical protein